ncbi:MAG TPA: type II secretion system protein [Clostridiaceae bacterium]
MNFRKPGFTLIEILLTMSMMIILSGVFIPKYLGYKEKSLKDKAIFTGRELQAAVMTSFSENGSFIPVDIIDITEKTTELSLGINSINVDKTNGNIVTISYVCDEKTYSLYVDASNGFKILIKDKVIYDKLEAS